MNIDKARKFAIEKHGNQKYGDHPYVYHLDSVLSVLKEFGIDDNEILISAILHDTLEDTDTTDQEISSFFGESVLNIVRCVTNESGKNRKERIKKTYEKIKNNYKATILKIADRISNARESKKNSSKLFEMYLREYPDFRQNLKQTVLDSKTKKMWDELDQLFY